MDQFKGTADKQQAARLAEIVRVAARHGWADWLRHVPSPWPRVLLSGS